VTTLEKQVGLGDARITYPDKDRPKYPAIARAITRTYQDLLRPLLSLRETVFAYLPLTDSTKQEEERFRYLARHRRILDEAIDLFLVEMAGPDRSREGYVNGGMESDTPDGVLQLSSVLSFATGIARAGEVMGVPTTVLPVRQSPAVRKMLDGAFELLSENGRMRLENIRDDIHSILVSATDAGLSPLETSRQLSRQFDHYSGYEFERLARTEAAYAAEAGSREQYREFGVSHVYWLISAGACSQCKAYEGQIIPIEDEVRQPPEHPQCCVEGTVVSGPKALASTERWFVGEVVDLETRSGNVLTVTPNHPILTPKGWVAAGLLNEGDEVISSTGGEVPTMGAIHPDDYQIPARIEEVARTFGSSVPVPTTRVPTTAEDFHGDGLGSEVCIVRTDSALRDALDAPLPQPLRGNLFCWRHAEALGLNRTGSGTLRLVRVGVAATSRVRSFGHLLSPLGAATRRESGLYVAATVDSDVALPQHPEDDGTADLKVPSESELVFAGKVEPDQLVLVQRRDFAGHVFNLQTNCGWYLASNIVSHNCLCSTAPVGTNVEVEGE
jgi:hypothetical protein